MDTSILLENLQSRGFIPHFVNSSAEAKDLILKLIPITESTGLGGSVTLSDLGIAEALKERGNTVYHRAFFPKNDRINVMLNAGRADWFLTSTNAITLDGELVNTDGIANRISSMVFGGANTLVVCGVNKIVSDIASAFERIRNESAPKNSKRLNQDTPCAKGENCVECKADKTICRATTIIHYPPMLKKFHIIIINENLGF